MVSDSGRGLPVCALILAPTPQSTLSPALVLQPALPLTLDLSRLGPGPLPALCTCPSSRVSLPPFLHVPWQPPGRWQLPRSLGSPPGPLPRSRKALGGQIDIPSQRLVQPPVSTCRSGRWRASYGSLPLPRRVRPDLCF